MSEINEQPVYKRQRFLLTFVRQLKGGVTSTDLQKLVFLHKMEEHSDFYEFIPYKYGSYSFQLAEDISTLHRGGFLSTDGTRIAPINKHPQGDSLVIAVERGDNLIRRVYNDYPYYAINSDIIGRIFQGKDVERFRNERMKYIQANQMLFTIGYEGMGIEAFINTLIQNDIRVLCDVRKNPLSRKFGFSKGKLEHITGTIGIKYIHIPELGIDSDKRNSLQTNEDYRSLFREYAKTLFDYKSQLDWLYSLLHSENRIALMCYEKDPKTCHRHIIKDYLTVNHEIGSTDI